MKAQWTLFVTLFVVSPARPLVAYLASQKTEVLKDFHSKITDMRQALLTAQEGLDALEVLAQKPNITYNRETPIEGTTTTYETIFAVLFVIIIAVGPAVAHVLSEPGKPTKTVYAQALVTVVVLIAGIYSFMNVVLFESAHFVGPRHLTMVESVYLLSQIITTVGYGDIVPSHPLGLVIIGSFVIASLFLIMGMISRVSGAVVQRVEMYSHQLTEQVFEEHMSPRGPTSHFFKKPKISYFPVLTSGGALLVFAFAGVCFFHLYPGEEKTLLQALYMSIITLSTTGFGAFTATTEGGKVFGAFWMIFGVAALASFLGAFAEFFLKLKERERHSEARVRTEMEENLNKMKGGTRNDHLNRDEFMCFAAMQLRIANWDQLESILWQFDELKPGQDGKVDMRDIEAKIQGTKVPREDVEGNAAEIRVDHGP